MTEFDMSREEFEAAEAAGPEHVTILVKNVPMTTHCTAGAGFADVVVNIAQEINMEKWRKEEKPRYKIVRERR